MLAIKWNYNFVIFFIFYALGKKGKALFHMRHDTFGEFQLSLKLKIINQFQHTQKSSEPLVRTRTKDMNTTPRAGKLCHDLSRSEADSWLVKKWRLIF